MESVYYRLVEIDSLISRNITHTAEAVLREMWSSAKIISGVSNGVYFSNIRSSNVFPFYRVARDRAVFHIKLNKLIVSVISSL